MKVSVIIPTYYREHDLSELLDSLLQQSIKPLEVIVVDDTPTFIIKSACEKYEKKFANLGISLIYIKNPKQRSAAIARNVGAKKADGDILMFFDSDIILYPDYIEKIVDVFQKYSNAFGVQGWIANATKPDINPLIKCLEIIFGIHQYLVKDQCKFKQYPIILTRVINCEWLSGSNMSLKREVLENFQFDENLKKYSYMEDKLFSFSIYRSYPNSLYMTPYAKCIHKGSEVGRMESRELKKHKNFCRKYVLTELYGLKGLFIYYRQNVGHLIIGLIGKILSFVKRK